MWQERSTWEPPRSAAGSKLVDNVLPTSGCRYCLHLPAKLAFRYHKLTRATAHRRKNMFCETWESDELLTKHSNSEHFTRLVPQIEALTKDGLHLERFEE